MSSAGLAASSVSITPSSASAVVSQASVTVDSTVTGTTIIAANATRKGGELRIFINATQGVYISFGGSASATSRFYAPGDIISLLIGGCLYTGAIKGFVPSGSEIVEVTEL